VVSLSNEAWQHVSPFLRLYDIDVRDVRSVGQGRYLLSGGSRAYEARIIPKSSAWIRREVSDFTANRRFRTTQRFIANKDQQRFVTVDSDRVFYVTDAWDGEPLDVTPQGVQDAVENLIRLHHALSELNFQRLSDAANNANESGVSVPQARYGNWLSALKHASSQFATARLLLRSKGLSTSGDAKVWNDWLARWEAQANEAANALAESGYDDIAKQAKVNGEIAWNDYHPGQLRRLPDGRIATLQVKDPVFDNRLYDLASLCQSICSHGHADGVLNAVSQYKGAIKLSPEEQRAVIAYAAFPHHASGLLYQARKHGLDGLDSNWRRRAELQHDAASRLLSESK
jgi:hypothetical protein